MKRLQFFFFLIGFLFAASIAIAQTSNDIDFVVTKINNNYPGLSFKKKLNIDSLLNKEHTTDTFRILSKITLFYKDKHLIVYDFANKQFYEDSTLLKKRGDSVQHSLKIRLKNNKATNVEGYWRSDYNNCVVAIVKDVAHLNSYKAFVMASSSGIAYGARLFTLEKTGDSFLTDYTDPDGKYRFFCYSDFKNKDTVLLNSSYGKWIKIKNYKQDPANTLKGFSFAPELISLDTSTILFKLPDSGVPNVAIVDSLIKKFYNQIAKAQTLIIDIRNNAGGTIRSYYPLLPFIASGNVIKNPYFQYCTKDILDDKMKSLARAQKDGRTDRVTELKTQIDTMQKSLGKFIFYKSDTLKFDTIYKRPKNVGIITNYACMSAAEYMLLDCMQSSKVKVFGERTGGAIEYLDNYSITTPLGKYALYIPATKRVRLSFEKTDASMKIVPDIILKDNIIDWVDFVKKYYEKL